MVSFPDATEPGFGMLEEVLVFPETVSPGLATGFPGFLIFTVFPGFLVFTGFPGFLVFTGLAGWLCFPEILVILFLKVTARALQPDFLRQQTQNTLPFSAFRATQ